MLRRPRMSKLKVTRSKRRLRESDDVLVKISKKITQLDNVLTSINKYCDIALEEAKNALKEPDVYDIDQIYIDLGRIIRVLDEADENMRDI